MDVSIANSVAIQPDGKIVVAGSESDGDGGQFSYFALIRYNRNGTIDSTFSDDGKLVDNVGGGYDEAFSVAIQPDNKIVVGGHSGLDGKYGFIIKMERPTAALQTRES